MSRKILKGDPQYPLFLAKYLNTKEGQSLAICLMSQLVYGFETGAKDRIKTAYIDDTKPITLDME